MKATTAERRRLMRAVLTSAQLSGDSRAPWRDVRGIEDDFESEAELLLELHREWLRLLVGRLHRGEIVPSRPVADVTALYAEVRRDHPTLRGILDAHRANPVLWEPTAREHAMLARIAGLADADADVLDAASSAVEIVAQVPAQRTVAG